MQPGIPSSSTSSAPVALRGHALRAALGRPPEPPEPAVEELRSPAEPLLVLPVDCADPFDDACDGPEADVESSPPALRPKDLKSRLERLGLALPRSSQ